MSSRPRLGGEVLQHALVESEYRLELVHQRGIRLHHDFDVRQYLFERCIGGDMAFLAYEATDLQSETSTGATSPHLDHSLREFNVV